MAFWKRRGKAEEEASTKGPAGSSVGRSAGKAGTRPGAGSGSGAAAAAAGTGPGGGRGNSGKAGAHPKPGSGPSPGLDTTTFLRGDTGEDSRSLELLLHTIAKVSASRDLESLLDFVVDSSIEATGAERGFLVLMDDRTGGQVVRVARERNSDGASASLGRDVKYSTSVVKHVVDSDSPIKTTLQKDGEGLDLGNSVFDLKLRAVMCVPLVPRSGSSGDAPVSQSDNPTEGTIEALPRGALYVDSRAATRDFVAEDLALFHALAQHIAIALENAQLNLHSIERARLERSLEIAAEIQSGLMPKSPPSIDGFDLFGWYRSAEHASGDFYDFVRTKTGGVAAVVGDVTGHGVGPALVTATAQASLRSYARVLEDPGAVVTMLNADLSERMDDGMFLTLFVAELEVGGGVRILNAGHTPPLIWRAATQTIESIPSDGPALGLMEDLEYKAREPIQLDEGDVLLAFTDGLVEARHLDHPERFFEEQGVRAVLADRGHEKATARETVEAVAKAALEFAAGAREDDVTIVAIRRVASSA